MGKKGVYQCRGDYCTLINTPTLLHTHTYHICVSMKQIWCVYHTAVFTVYLLTVNQGQHSCNIHKSETKCKHYSEVIAGSLGLTFISWESTPPPLSSRYSLLIFNNKSSYGSVKFNFEVQHKTDIQLHFLQTHVLLIGSLLGTTSSSLPLFSHSLHF